jgi:putative iron-only hydrogenase system regulator
LLSLAGQGRLFYFFLKEIWRCCILKRIAIIGAVMDNPRECQSQFNDLVAEYKHIVRGRMGIPFHEEGISVISITVCGTLDEINGLTGKLGNISSVNVKTAFSKKELG